MIRIALLSAALASPVAADDLFTVGTAEVVLSFAPTDVAAVAGGPGDGAVSVQLTEDAALRFGAFTRDHLGERIRVTRCGRTIMRPVIHDAIFGGTLLLTVAEGMSAQTLRDEIAGAAPCP
ncbi:hypothetical protein JSE7799_00638 [Jannaschia seosinensis]|uniref:Preprotein translocase subunit SecD n=1 Tax=Jannaschia seosinensis TaxID=313367 RepID=A0A0M7B538_9RHOB|nr:hypothetical protein [Jannaschia seosinensis]CUH23630.1 hypothetical protein JSE7799_00638 [Jannaschia seosinensis]